MPPQWRQTEASYADTRLTIPSPPPHSNFEGNYFPGLLAQQQFEHVPKQWLLNTSRRIQITHPFCHRVIINSKVKKEKSLLQEHLDLHSAVIVNNDPIGKVTKNVNAKTQKM